MLDKTTMDDLITYHLSGSENEVSASTIHKSSFSALLRDARSFTNRDIVTGEKISGSRHDGWLGLTAYLILLDQIGSCFNLIGGPRNNRNFLMPLVQFSDLSIVECEAIYALRCSMAHDYSLCNKDRNRKLWHMFELANSDSSPVVSLPNKPWDGNYSNFNNMTRIHVVALCDLVEDIVTKVKGAHRDGKLELRLGMEEFGTRYSIFHPK